MLRSTNTSRPSKSRISSRDSSVASFLPKTLASPKKEIGQDKVEKPAPLIFRLSDNGPEILKAILLELGIFILSNFVNFKQHVKPKDGSNTSKVFLHTGISGGKDRGSLNPYIQLL